MVWEAKYPDPPKEEEGEEIKEELKWDPKPPLKTPIVMCNHAYWNISGDFEVNTIRTHRLRLNCDSYLPMDDYQIPTGEIKHVVNTPFDFTTGGEKSPYLITSLNRLDGAIDGGGENGIDHAYVINRPENSSGDNILREAAELMHPSTGRRMVISTTQNCLVVYTSNFLPKPKKDDDGDKHIQHAAICLETTQFNNAVNMIGKEGWPKEEQVFLMADKPYKHATLHKFYEK